MARNGIILLWVGIVAIFMCSGSYADVPQMINYQGKLTTASGGCLNDTVQMTFTIYADSLGDTAKWGETQDEVVVKEGVFSVLLGSVNPIPDMVFDGSTKYLGVRVEADPEMRPLKPMVTTGYAFRSQEADTAEYARTAPAMPDDDWVIRGDTIYHEEGNVGIGTAQPQARLDIAGGNYDLTSTEGDLKIGSDDYRLKIGVRTDIDGGDVFIRPEGGTGRMFLGSGYPYYSLVLKDKGVGLGINSPEARLHVRATSFYNTGFKVETDGNRLMTLAHISRATGYSDDGSIYAALKIEDTYPYGAPIALRVKQYSSAGWTAYFDGGNGVRVDMVRLDGSRVGTLGSEPLTLTPGSGNVQVEGSVTATTYYGDGSNLTGIQPAPDNDWTIDEPNVYHETGNVGIGTTNPQAPLDIYARGDGAKLLRLNTERPWVFKQHSTGSGTELWLQAESDCKMFSIVGYDGTKVASFWSCTGGDDDIYFNATNIWSTGYMQHGGNIYASGSVTANTYYGDGSHLTGIEGTTDNDWTIDGNNVYHEIGNVGIGTASPQGRLSIQNVGSNDDINMLTFSEDDNAEFHFESGFSGSDSTGNALKLKTFWGSYPMTWRGDGCVGIGTTNPGAKLDVEGNAQIIGTTDAPHPLLRVRNDGEGQAMLVRCSTTTSGIAAIEAQAIDSIGNTFGLYGITNSSSSYSSGSGSAAGVYGLANYSEADGGDAFGVLGVCKTSGGDGSPPNDFAAGVYGQAHSSITEGKTAGVFGESWSRNPNGAGVVGKNNAPSGPTRGVWGEVESDSGAGVFGRNASPADGSTGGRFESATHGTVDIAHWEGGTFYAIKGPGTKSCVVSTSKGKRTLFASESPEVWFEDFGEAELKNGYAHVDLDALFLETVTISEKHPMKVFVQMNDNCKGVYVKRGTIGFDVYELNDGKNNAHFTYRIVAKRKGYEDKRLEKVEQELSSK